MINWILLEEKINDEIFGIAAEFCKNGRVDLRSHLKKLGYTDEEIEYSGLKNVSCSYKALYDDFDNTVGLINDMGQIVKNKNYDTFFGCNFDKKYRYIILTLDKNFVFKAEKLGIKNVVSLLSKPINFFPTQNKLDFIREYGNTVILHGADNEYFDSIKQILLSNKVNVL